MTIIYNNNTSNIDLTNTYYFVSANLTEESVSNYISTTDFSDLSSINIHDLNVAKNILKDKLFEIKNDLDPTLPTSKQSQLNGVLGNISESTNDFNEIRNDLAGIEAQLDARTEELSNRLHQEGVSLSTIKTTLNNFKTAQAALNQVLANPTVNLYASGTKKIIPLKKRIKLFLTLNGKEQWAAPPTVQFISISALVSSTLKQGTNNPKYSRAGRWRDITKSLKPKLAREAGRYYIELDARGAADFPADYFDEFVIRYDNPAQWSGEVLRWSWGAGATVGSGAGLVQTAQQLTTSMEQIVDILDELLGEGGSEG